MKITIKIGITDPEYEARRNGIIPKKFTGSPAVTSAPQFGCSIIAATDAAKIGLHLNF
jgi:hypothetical protein